MESNSEKKVKMTTKIAIGFGFGMVVIIFGACLFWILNQRETNDESAQSTRNIAEALAVLKVDLKNIRNREANVEKSILNIKNELDRLRFQYLAPRQVQASPDNRTTIATDRELIEERASENKELGLGLESETFVVDENDYAESLMLEQVELLEDSLISEESDPQWSTWAEQTLADTYKGEQIAGLELEDALCQTSLCRVSFFLDGSNSSEETVRTIPFLTPWSSSVFFQIKQSDGETNHQQAVFYIAREGYTLPQLMN